MSFWLFSIVGALGFVIDAATFHTANLILDNYYLSRLVSYVAAATFTWFLNRSITFRSSAKSVTSLPSMFVELFKYLLSQTAGFSINYLTFSALVTFIGFFRYYPVLAIAVGSILGLLANYLAAKNFIFRASQPK